MNPPEEIQARSVPIFNFFRKRLISKDLFLSSVIETKGAMAMCKLNRHQIGCGLICSDPETGCRADQGLCESAHESVLKNP